MSKFRSPDRPVCFAGKVVLEFFANDDEGFKSRSLDRLIKGLTREFGISCVAVNEHLLENPERGALALALVERNHTVANKRWRKALDFLDANAPARIIDDTLVKGEL